LRVGPFIIARRYIYQPCEGHLKPVFFVAASWQPGTRQVLSRLIHCLQMLLSKLPILLAKTLKPKS
jgi:hypothetical protein